MKTYYVTHNVGNAKYVVSYHDGAKKHNDGSDFFDIKIFSNRLKMQYFKRELSKDGYTQRIICH